MIANHFWIIQFSCIIVIRTSVLCGKHRENLLKKMRLDMEFFNQR